MDWISQLEIIGEVALAMLLGGMIGIEREMADKPAGFRTHMLVAGAAALLVGLGDALLHRFNIGANEYLRSDPIRIVEAIVTGISFLGAGTIFRRERGEQVEGLTTAASILLCSAIGIAVALRQFVLAAGTTVLALLTLRGLKFIEKWLAQRRQMRLNRSPDA
ncbi:MAG TPA: MgtC/SapB family protein [Pyrinomonadaceae bacterium]|jgi:putative Mg2+ transporter-C (MgtC) family protein